MSWLWGTPTVARICPKETFYFITPAHVEKGWFKMSSWNTIQITDKTVCDFPKDGKCVIVPRNIIDKINPRTDFNLRIRLKLNGEVVLLGDHSMGEMMLDNVTFGGSEQMTWALMSAGEWCVNMDQQILMVSKNLFIPKFDCKDVMDILNRCMNQAVSNFNSVAPASVTLECPEKEMSIHLTMRISDNLRTILNGTEVGTVKLPEKMD